MVGLFIFCVCVDVLIVVASEVKTYDAGPDSTLPSVPKKRKFENDETTDTQTTSPAVKKAKKVKKTEAEEDGGFLTGYISDISLIYLGNWFCVIVQAVIVMIRWHGNSCINVIILLCLLNFLWLSGVYWKVVDWEKYVNIKLCEWHQDWTDHCIVYVSSVSVL